MTKGIGHPCNFVYAWCKWNQGWYWIVDQLQSTFVRIGMMRQLYVIVMSRSGQTLITWYWRMYTNCDQTQLVMACNWMNNYGTYPNAEGTYQNGIGVYTRIEFTSLPPSNQLGTGLHLYWARCIAKPSQWTILQDKLERKIGQAFNPIRHFQKWTHLWRGRN